MLSLRRCVPSGSIMLLSWHRVFNQAAGMLQEVTSAVHSTVPPRHQIMGRCGLSRNTSAHIAAWLYRCRPASSACARAGSNNKSTHGRAESETASLCSSPVSFSTVRFPPLRFVMRQASLFFLEWPCRATNILFSFVLCLLCRSALFVAWPLCFASPSPSGSLVTSFPDFLQ